MCGFSVFVKIRHFDAKSLFLTKENMLGVGFKLWKPPANNQFTNSFGKWRHSFALILGEDLVGKRQGRIAFWSKGALVLVFLHWVGYTLKVGSTKALVLWSLWDGHHTHIAFPCLWKEGIFNSNQASPQRIACFEWVSYMKNHCIPSLHTELWAAELVFRPRSMKGLGGTNARVAFQSNMHWDWCSFTE